MTDAEASIYGYEQNPKLPQVCPKFHKRGFCYTVRGHVQKLFRIKGEAPLSVSGRNHANLLRCSSVPPLQRLCQEVVLRASREKRAMHVACTCRRAFRPCALDYTIIVIIRPSAKRNAIPYLHLNQGRNRDVRGA